MKCVYLHKVKRKMYFYSTSFINILKKTKLFIKIKENIEYIKFKKSFTKKITSDYIISSESDCLYRNSYYNKKNKTLVELCKNNDVKGLSEWYKNTDSDKIYYDEIYEHRMSMRIIARYIENNISRSAYILDVACGHGSIDKYLAKKGYRIKGIDLNPNRINEIKDYIYEAECVDVDNIEKNLKYNVIISLEMLEHVPDVKRTLHNIYNLLEEKGYLFISVPFENMIDDEQHVRFFSKDSLISLLNEGGFNVIAVTRLSYLNHESGNDLICVCSK